MPMIPVNPAASAARARVTSWSKDSRICGRKRLNSMVVMRATVLALGGATPFNPPAAEQAPRTRTGDIAERAVVGARLARHPEQPLADHVACHLGGAASDARTPCAREVPGEAHQPGRSPDPLRRPPRHRTAGAGLAPLDEAVADSWMLVTKS